MNTQTGADQGEMLSGKDHVFHDWSRFIPAKKMRVVRFPDLQGNQYREVHGKENPSNEIIPKGAWIWQYVTLTPTRTMAGNFESVIVKESHKSPMFYYGYEICDDQFEDLKRIITKEDASTYLRIDTNRNINNWFSKQNIDISKEIKRYIVWCILDSLLLKGRVVVTGHFEFPLPLEQCHDLKVYKLFDEDKVLGLLPPWVSEDFKY